MRKTRLILPFISVLVVTLATLSTWQAHAADEKTKQGVKQETSEALKAIKGYTVDQKDEALEQARLIMGVLDAQIDRQEEKLRQEWHKLDTSARERWKQTLGSLKKKRNELSERYGGLQQSSSQAWDDLKTGFSDAYLELGTAWEEAEKEFEAQ